MPIASTRVSIKAAIEWKAAPSLAVETSRGRLYPRERIGSMPQLIRPRKHNKAFIQTHISKNQKIILAIKRTSI